MSIKIVDQWRLGEEVLQEKLKILICDDSLLVRQKLREDLEAQGCQVHDTKDGQEAVQAFADQRPDAVFLDIVMPKMDGLQALEAIKKSIIAPTLSCFHQPVLLLNY